MRTKTYYEVYSIDPVNGEMIVYDSFERPFDAFIYGTSLTVELPVFVGTMRLDESGKPVQYKTMEVRRYDRRSKE